METKKLLSLREQQMLQLGILQEIHQVCVKNDLKYFMMFGTLIGAVRHKGFIPWDDDIDIVMPREDFDRFNELCENGALKHPYLIQNRHTDPEFEFVISRVAMRGTYSDDHSRRKLKSMNYTYIDVFPLDHVPDSFEERKKQEKNIRRLKTAVRYRMNYRYDENSKLKLGLKFLLSLPFKCLPLSWYMTRLQNEIIKYNSVPTRCCGTSNARYGYSKETYATKDFENPILLSFEGKKFYAPAEYDKILKNLYGDYMKLPPESNRKIRHRVYLIEECE